MTVFRESLNTMLSLEAPPPTSGLEATKPVRETFRDRTDKGAHTFTFDGMHPTRWSRRPNYAKFS